MKYSLEGGIWSSVFAVPTELVDKHLKLCGRDSLKVLLVLLRHGGQIEDEQIASLLNISLTDVQDAFHYWVQLGFVQRGEEPLAEKPQPQQAEPQPAGQEGSPVTRLVPPPQEDSQQVVRLTRARPKLTTRDITQMAASDQNIVYLLQESQGVLGKPLTAQATEVIVSLYSYYGMAPDLILMLVHYCVTDGRDSVHNIERQAARWMEKGVDTHEKAEKEILRCAQRRNIYGQVQALLGINDRRLISKEKRFINAWTEEYGQSPDLIGMAYERCVEAIGKLSFDYMGGILKSWKQSGITTPQQAAQEARPESAKGKVPGSKEKPSSSYSMDELERMVTYGPVGGASPHSSGKGL
ncbi:DnaD domain protein [Oscillospiraceae bacterium MB08-C2-2]|nr:DnaD domain protein [Oscillospiraceae bacterium MB08-C2-2]